MDQFVFPCPEVEQWPRGLELLLQSRQRDMGLQILVSQHQYLDLYAHIAPLMLNT